MHPYFWSMMDALQAGALMVLTLVYLADALVRRDRAMGWLSLTCALIGLRHLVLGLGELHLYPAGLDDRLQSSFASLGFIALVSSFRCIFPKHLPARLPLAVGLAMVPNFIRNLAVPRASAWDAPLHHVANLGYVVFSLWLLAAVYRARRDADPMAQRLFVGMVVIFLPVFAEVGALTFFKLKVPLSGFSLVLLATFLGASWQWFIAHSLREELDAAHAESAAWRRLVPRKTWRTGEASDLMAARFGAQWPQRLMDRMQDGEGQKYIVHREALSSGEQLGWLEPYEETLPGTGGFLSGWEIALGLDDTEEATRLTRLLRAWGAEVQAWGTVPPREGPFPSILLWGREPSILSVWREDSHARRLPRWVQLGGPSTEGPHARLDLPLQEGRLQELLQALVTLS